MFVFQLSLSVLDKTEIAVSYNVENTYGEIYESLNCTETKKMPVIIHTCIFLRYTY